MLNVFLRLCLTFELCVKSLSLIEKGNRFVPASNSVIVYNYINTIDYTVLYTFCFYRISSPTSLDLSVVASDSH